MFGGGENLHMAPLKMGHRCIHGCIILLKGGINSAVTISSIRLICASAYLCHPDVVCRLDIKLATDVMFMLMEERVILCNSEAH